MHPANLTDIEAAIDALVASRGVILQIALYGIPAIH